jgi:hypothetical protein
VKSEHGNIICETPTWQQTLGCFGIAYCCCCCFFYYYYIIFSFAITTTSAVASEETDSRYTQLRAMIMDAKFFSGRKKESSLP